MIFWSYNAYMRATYQITWKS